MSASVADLRLLVQALSSGAIEGDELVTTLYCITDLLEQNDTSNVIGPWTSGTLYDTPEAGNGNPGYADFEDRLWKSKVDANQNNQPPSDPGTTENTFWTEVSKGSTNLFKEWSPGIYGEGLVIVFHNDTFLKLLVAQRPFESANIVTELGEGKWKDLLAGLGGGPGGSSADFNLTLDGSVTTVAPTLAALAGFTVDDLNSYPGGVAQFIADWIIPTIPAYRQSSKSASLSGVSSQTVEDGTSMAPTLTGTFSQGQINNGDNSVAGPLVGAATSYEFRDPSNTVISHTPDVPIDNSQQAPAPNYVIGFGSNYWRVTINHAAGSTLYYDNKDTENADSNLSGETGAGSIVANSGTITGRRNRWHYLGGQGTSPTGSAGVRALSTDVLLNGSNAGTFNVLIPAGTEEFSFYIPQGKSITVIDLGNLNLDITGNFTRTNMNVDNANAVAIGYERNTVFIGVGGFPSDTTYQVTIS